MINDIIKEIYFFHKKSITVPNKSFLNVIITNI